MPVIQCPIDSCAHNTGEVDPAVAAALLMVHINVHIAAAGSAPAVGKQRAPKIARPSILKVSSEETWNAFFARWGIYKRGTNLISSAVKKTWVTTYSRVTQLP